MYQHLQVWVDAKISVMSWVMSPSTGISQIHVHALPTRTRERDITWKDVFVEVIKLTFPKWDDPRLFRWTLNPMTCVLRWHIQRETWRGRGHVETGADGAAQPQHHKLRGHQKLEAAWRDSPPEPSKECSSADIWILDFGLATVGEYIFVS